MIGLHRAKWIAVAAAIVLSACSSVTRLEGTVPGTTLAIKGLDRTELPRSEDLASKATGQYEFMARAPDGTTLYGILPLKVSGGKMAGSILFFAPALFIGGFRDVFPFYQFDTDRQVVLYKMKQAEEWRVYTPIGAERARAKASFDALAPGVPAARTGGSPSVAPTPAQAP
jgi:hypothetical protein